MPDLSYIDLRCDCAKFELAARLKRVPRSLVESATADGGEDFSVLATMIGEILCASLERNIRKRIVEPIVRSARDGILVALETYYRLYGGGDAINKSN